MLTSATDVLLVGWRPAAVAALQRHGARVSCIVSPGDLPATTALLAPSDVLVAANPSNMEDVLAGLLRAGRSPASYDRVLSQHEFTLVPAAVLAAGTGPVSVAAALHLRDKHLQKTRLRAAGVPVADYVLFLEPTQLVDIPFDCGVVKPLAQASTRGVEAWTGARERMEVADRLRQAGGGPWLAERYVVGAELHVDGIVRDGRVIFAAVGRYLVNLLTIRDGGLNASVSQHPFTRAPLVEAALALAMTSLEALGHRDGVFHLELFETKQGLVFSECAGRVAGGTTAEVVRRQHAVDLHDEWARAALGLPSAVRPETSERVWGDVFLTLPAGLLRECPSVEELNARPGVAAVVKKAKPGDILPDASAASDRCVAMAVVEAEDELRLAGSLEELTTWFRRHSWVEPVKTVEVLA